MPSVGEVGGGIMRVNCGHDSNIQREMVIETTAQYPRRFFNTSIPRFDFPAPVVFTANRKEEKPATSPPDCQAPNNLMYVRLRVSATNLAHIADAVRAWTVHQVPVVLTFMAYYTKTPVVPEKVERAVGSPCYAWKVRHINSYHCPTPAFCGCVMRQMKAIGNRLVVMCGNLDSAKCADCRNCETYYWQTMKHMQEAAREESTE